jgi:hypothetical protein
MPVFRSGKKKSDEYYCKIFTMDAELQFTIEVNEYIFYVKLFDFKIDLGNSKRKYNIFTCLSNNWPSGTLVFWFEISR